MYVPVRGHARSEAWQPAKGRDLPPPDTGADLALPVSILAAGQRGDTDGDGDVDLADFLLFAECFTGPKGTARGRSVAGEPRLSADRGLAGQLSRRP